MIKIDLMLKEVENGDFNPLEAYILIKKSIEKHTQALGILQKEAYDEADKYPEKTIKDYEGFIIEKSNTGARYNWNQDDIYKELETKLKMNEFVLWNEVIDPTSGGLDLKGETRTSFVTSTDFDGLNSTDPGIANVLTTASYIINGSAKTGTLGVSTDPGESNVSTGINYTANGVSKTGTLDTVTNVLNNQSIIGSNRTGTLTAS